MLNTVNNLLWGPGTLAFLLGTGLFLTIRMHFLPWRRLPFALQSALGKDARTSKHGGIPPFSALMTTLAATMGTGNIVGVATALVAGGPGALIWMEISALVGMSTIFAESMLSVRYRRRNRQGHWYGGPMYVMESALGSRFGRISGFLFALLATGASFGIGSITQSSAIASALESAFGLPIKLTGSVTTAFAVAAILGGMRSISKITSILVPLMSVFYMMAGIVVILSHPEHLLPGLASIFQCAFSAEAIVGGMAGEALRWGIARGVFSNEAGLGSAGIAAASADTNDPVRQGYISMTGAFFDTVLVCTVTGLAICCSGVLGATDGAGTPINGAALTLLAFETVFGRYGSGFIAVSIVLFAFSTILGWEYQGEQAFSYLSKGRGTFLYRTLYALTLLWGSGQQTDTVYLFSDICNALMCIPNLLCVLLLHRQVIKEMRDYKNV